MISQSNEKMNTNTNNMILVWDMGRNLLVV